VIGNWQAVPTGGQNASPSALSMHHRKGHGHRKPPLDTQDEYQAV